MGTMAVLLPTVGETWLMQEECCWQLRSVYAPALPLRLASNQLHAASLEPVALGLDDYADAVPWADNYGLVYTWRFGAQLEPILRELIARGRLREVIEDKKPDVVFTWAPDGLTGHLENVRRLHEGYEGHRLSPARAHGHWRSSFPRIRHPFRIVNCALAGSFR